jgi:adenine-specific DNA-methyltransferase
VEAGCCEPFEMNSMNRERSILNQKVGEVESGTIRFRGQPLFNQNLNSKYRGHHGICMASDFTHKQMPMTRYQGSKRRIVDWIIGAVKDLDFESALDIMGGTGTVAYNLKKLGKTVTYNDFLLWNYHNGVALIENDSKQLENKEIEYIFTRDESFQYDDIVERIFEDVYFTNNENKEIDMISQNISRIDDSCKRSLAYFCLSQVLIMKRPYNLFHRKNLYMRIDEVERSFGNKTTWEKPIGSAFRDVADQLNKAIFDNGKECQSINQDCFEVRDKYDLVYIDSPYLNAKGTGVDYRGFYHFLDGICDYENWEEKIDFGSKHRRLVPEYNPWNDPKKMERNFKELFNQHSDSIIVVSYRSDGTPSVAEIKRQLERVKKDVKVYYRDGLQYALSPNKKSAEVLLIGTD